MQSASYNRPRLNSVTWQGYVGSHAGQLLQAYHHACMVLTVEGLCRRVVSRHWNRLGKQCRKHSWRGCPASREVFYIVSALTLYTFQGCTLNDWFNECLLVLVFQLPSSLWSNCLQVLPPCIFFRTRVSTTPREASLMHAQAAAFLAHNLYSSRLLPADTATHRQA